MEPLPSLTEPASLKGPKPIRSTVAIRARACSKSRRRCDAALLSSFTTGSGLLRCGRRTLTSSTGLSTSRTQSTCGLAAQTRACRWVFGVSVAQAAAVQHTHKQQAWVCMWTHSTVLACLHMAGNSTHASKQGNACMGFLGRPAHSLSTPWQVVDSQHLWPHQHQHHPQPHCRPTKSWALRLVRSLSSATWATRPCTPT